jgi:hypothetical protein
MKKLVPLLLLTACCTTPAVQSQTDPVRIVRSKKELDERCKLLGKMKWGGLNAILNEDAIELGADTVYLHDSGENTVAFFLRCKAGALKQPPMAATRQSPTPPMDAPNFAPDSPETLPKPKLYPLPDPTPQDPLD